MLCGLASTEERLSAVMIFKVEEVKMTQIEKRQRVLHWLRRSGLIFFPLIVFVLLFQNCGEGFVVQQPQPVASQSSSEEVSRVAGIEVLSKPGAVINSPATEISFRTESFNGGDIVSVECSYNGSSYLACQSPLSFVNLEEGAHKVDIKVRTSKDQESTLRVSWQVDATPTMVNISSGPTAVTQSRTASLMFVVNDQNSGVAKTECRLNKTLVSDCRSPHIFQNLADGSYVFEVLSTDKAGNVGRASYSWVVSPVDNVNSQGTLWFWPMAISSIANPSRAFILDSYADALIRVDLMSGNRTTISSPHIGTGPRLLFPIALAVNSTETQAFVVDIWLDALVRVDLVNGNRVIVSNANIGAGGQLGQPRNIFLSPDGSRALLAGFDSVISVDLSNGNKTTIALRGASAQGSANVAFNSEGTRIYLVDRQGYLIRWDLTDNTTRVISDRIERHEAAGAMVWINQAETKAFVLQSDSFSLLGTGTLFQWDLASATRIEISRRGLGAGPDIGSARAFSVNSTETSALILSGTDLIRVQLATGDRQVISSSNLGEGPALKSPSKVSIHTSSNRAYLLDPSSKGIFEVNVINGERRVVSSEQVGKGPLLLSPSDMVISANAIKAYVVDSQQDALLEVDLVNGDRRIVSGMNEGQGPNMRSPSGVSINAKGTQVYIVDSELNAVLRVDLVNGSRHIVSSSQLGGGPALSTSDSLGYIGELSAISLNSLETQAFVHGGTRLLRVDLKSGDRAVVSDAWDGRGPGFRAPGALAISSSGSHAYITTMSSIDRMNDGAIIRVDLSTGERLAVSSNQTGTGPVFERPAGIAIPGNGSQAFVVDQAFRALFRVDLTTGNRSVVSK